MTTDCKAMRPWVALAALWTAAFALSCSLVSSGAALSTSGTSASIASVLFGEARHALGQQFYSTADQYFHRGVQHIEDRAFESGLFFSLHQAASPEEHLHLSTENIAEMLPWLWMALRMDPHNVEAFRVTAFWLANAANELDAAEEVLREAQQNNPYSYAVKLDMGRLYLKRGDMARAAHNFDAALRFMPLSQEDDPEKRRLDAAEIFLCRGLIHESNGETAAALRHYLAILKLFPQREAIRRRIADLQEGRGPRSAARDLLTELLREQQAHTCDRENEGEHGCAHDECDQDHHTDCTHDQHDA